MKAILCTASLTAAVLLSFRMAAQPTPKLLPFQARLTDASGQPVPDGARVVRFQLFSEAAGGTPLHSWSGEVHRTTVNGGLINVVLGTRASLEGVDFAKTLYLEITVDQNG